MRFIIRVKSEEEINEFLDNVSHDIEKAVKIYIASCDINENGFNYKFDDKIRHMEILVPPPNIVSTMLNGDEETYTREVLRYYNNPEVAYIINQLIAELFNENRVIVFCCNKFEGDLKYLKILSDYIEDNYGIETYTVKKYMKDKKKFRKLDCLPDDILDIYRQRKEQLVMKIEEEGLVLGNLDRKKIMEGLKDKTSKKAFKLLKKMFK